MFGSGSETCKGCKSNGSRCQNTPASDCSFGRCSKCCVDRTCLRHGIHLGMRADGPSRACRQSDFDDDCVTNELCKCGSCLRRKTERDWFTGNDKVVFFCRSCHTRYTECALKKLTISRTPVEDLIRAGQLDVLTTERVKGYLQQKRLSTTGTKDDLVARALEICTAGESQCPESLKDASVALEQRRKETAAKKATLQGTSVLQRINPKRAAAPRHKCSADYFGQRHQPGLQQSFGVGSHIAPGTLHHVRDADIAIAMTAPSLRASVVVCSPKTGAVHALFEKLLVGDVQHALLDYFYYDGRRSHDYFRCDNTGRIQSKMVYVGGVGQVPPKWSEVYIDDNLVIVLQREGYWSDMDWDFDKSFGRRNYYDSRPKGWGFTVSQNAWVPAWEVFIRELQKNRNQFAARDDRVSRGDVQTQAELEEFLSISESKEALLRALPAWGLSSSVRMAMPGGRSANQPRRLGDFTVLALKRLFQDKFADRIAVPAEPTTEHGSDAVAEERGEMPAGDTASSSSSSCSSGSNSSDIDTDDDDSHDEDRGGRDAPCSRSREPTSCAMASVDQVLKLLIAASSRGKQSEAIKYLLRCAQDQRCLIKLEGRRIDTQILHAALAKLPGFDIEKFKLDTESHGESARVNPVEAALPAAKRIRVGDAATCIARQA